MLIINRDAPNMVPRYNVESLLVYAAHGSDVRATIVAGKVLYMNGDYLTIDTETAIAEAREQAKLLASKQSVAV